MVFHFLSFVAFLLPRSFFVFENKDGTKKRKRQKKGKTTDDDPKINKNKEETPGKDIGQRPGKKSDDWLLSGLILEKPSFSFHPFLGFLQEASLYLFVISGTISQQTNLDPYFSRVGSYVGVPVTKKDSR